MSINHAPQARAASPGCFYIPAIDASVPAQFSQDQQRSRTLARFAAAAAAAGVALPAGDFLNIEQVVKNQWVQFLENRYPAGLFQTLAGAPVINVTDESLTVVITAISNLNVYRLKPVVESLESLAEGLGWFVHSAIRTAGYHGLEIYDTNIMMYLLDCFHWNIDEYTDQAYARSLLMDQGQDPPDGPIPQETIDQLRDQYSYWPSDVMAEVGQHEHLLGNCPPSRRPPTMTARKAKQWLRESGGHELAPVVQTAIELDAACQRDKKRAFIWDMNEDETEPLGAMCFLAWDNPALLLEAVEHHEQNAYNGGQAVEAFARCHVPSGCSDADLRDLARATADYFNRWALLAKLLSHFPIWEDDDET